jgi:serine/threonine-protein kinase
MNGPTYRELLAHQGSGFTEPEVRQILAQVLPQLMHFHHQGSAHGGISPDTLVQDATNASTHLIPALPLTDSSYIAPECLQTGQATAAGDVYGLGVTLLTLLSGQSPLVLQPSPGIWNWRPYCAVSDPFANLLDKMIALHPQLRYADAMQVFQTLQALPVVTQSSAPTADPPTQTIPDSTPTSFATVPVAPVAASLDPDPPQYRSFPWPWIVLGIGSLLLLSLISFAANRVLNPTREPVGETPAEIPSATEPSPLPEEEIPDEEPANSAESPAPDAENPFASEDFPKATCGDAMPTDPAAFPVEFHPVFVPQENRNLRRIRAQFCEDAIAVTRKDTAERAIQVASFTSLERAEQFQQLLDEEFDNVEVGEATVYERSSEDEPPEEDASTQDAPPEVSTERIRFAPGEVSTRLRGEVSENQLQRYLINCGRAQEFTLRIDNGNVQAVVISPDGAVLGSIGEAGSQWQGILPSTGDYTLEITPLERSADYRILVEVL